MKLSEAISSALTERHISDSTRQVYSRTYRRLLEHLGDVDVSKLDDTTLRNAMNVLFGGLAPATFNRHRAATGSLMAHCVRRGWVTKNPVAMIEGKPVKVTNPNKVITYDDLKKGWSNQDVRIRDRCLWRMLYETAARAEELLQLNIENMNVDERQARIVGKGGNIEIVHWATATKWLLPKVMVSRNQGPLFLAAKRPTRPVPESDFCQATRRARLSYRRSAELFSEAFPGHTLHHIRHSRLTHLAEAGVDVTLLRAKSRHSSLRSLERYISPSVAAVAHLTALHDPANRSTPR